MKFSTIFWTFCILCFLLASQVAAQNVNKNNLVNYGCRITKDVIGTQQHTQDVLIGNLAGKNQFPIINGLTKCISNVNTVVVADMKTQMSKKDLKKASIVLLVLEKIDFVRKLIYFALFCDVVFMYVAMGEGVTGNKFLGLP